MFMMILYSFSLSSEPRDSFLKNFLNMYELRFPKFHCITSIEISEYVSVEISKVSLSIDALLQMKHDALQVIINIHFQHMYI